MKGSEKQIKWANQIQAKIAEQAKAYLGRNEKIDKAVNKILSIDNASFWIDYRDYDINLMLSSLQREGLRNRGFGYSNNIKIDRTYTITETWTEIVSDGKGGHKETKSKVW